MSSLHRQGLIVLGCLAIWTSSGHAQLPGVRTLRELPAAGSEWERYLRVLQLTGDIAPMQWSVRGLAYAQLARMTPADSGHPWRERSIWGIEDTPTLSVITPEARLIHNTAYPFGYNDGAVWAGRGATAVVSGGVAAHFGPLTVTAAPVAFFAQNAAFDLQPTGYDGRLRFAHGVRPGNIDAPQRFGDSRYSRVDWGQSGVRLEGVGLTAGFSTANQFWGPAAEHPVILGNNAGGFPHVFAGTARPIDLWIGRVHGRVIWGSLDQTEYSPALDRWARRLGSGLVGSFSPRGIPGLEIGAARFFHTPWPDSGLTRHHILKPFEGILKQSFATEENPFGDEPTDNQLASVFARWVFPRSGMEVYAEYGREDHNWDARDFWMQPDHIAAYTLGLQKAWRTREGILVGRGEVMNSRISHLQQVRGQSQFYVHGVVRQGHTQRGQVLGSAAGFGGGAATLAADYYRPDGRLTVSWARLMRAERRGTYALPVPDEADVMHALSADALLFRRGYDLTGGVTLVQDLNRDFARDAFNLNLTLGARARW